MRVLPAPTSAEPPAPSTKLEDEVGRIPVANESALVVVVVAKVV